MFILTIWNGELRVIIKEKGEGKKSHHHTRSTNKSESSSDVISSRLKRYSHGEVKAALLLGLSSSGEATALVKEKANEAVNMFCERLLSRELLTEVRREK